MLNSSISCLYLENLEIEILKFLFLLFFDVLYCSVTLLISLLTLFVFLDFEDLSHFHLFFIKFLKKFLYFFYFRELRVKSIKIVLKLVSFAHKASDTSHGFRTDNTLFMVSMSTLEMNWLLSVVDRIPTSFTIPISPEAVQFLIIVVLKLFP